MNDVHSVVAVIEKKCKMTVPDNPDDSDIHRYMMHRRRLYDVAYHVVLQELTIAQAIAELKPSTRTQ